MSTLPKDEPALATGGVFGVVGALLTTLFTHDAIGTVHASTDVKTLAPLVAAGIPVVFAAIIRHFVKPASKAAKEVEEVNSKLVVLQEKEHLMTDADFARLEGLLHEFFPQEVLDAFHVDTESEDETPSAAVQDGMTAGAPPA